MELTPKVIELSVGKMTNDSAVQGVIIPEESFGIGFWAQCKALERSFYVGNDDVEGARFFSPRYHSGLLVYDSASCFSYVPTRNSSEFLSACFKSIHIQTYPRIEVIIVDRDSTVSKVGW